MMYKIAKAGYTARTPDDFPEKLEAVIEKGDAYLHKEGWDADEYIGSYRGILETGHYMHARQEFA